MFRRLPVAAAAVFWLFITAVYDLQIWWLSHMPGERMDLRSVMAWQTPYFLLWFPITLVIWRITARWTPDSPTAWARIVARHVPLFLLAAGAHLVATVVCVAALGQLREPFLTALLNQMRGRLHLELLVYTGMGPRLSETSVLMRSRSPRATELVLTASRPERVRPS